MRKEIYTQNYLKTLKLEYSNLKCWRVQVLPGNKSTNGKIVNQKEA